MCWVFKSYQHLPFWTVSGSLTTVADWIWASQIHSVRPYQQDICHMLRTVVMNAAKMQSSMDCNFGGIPKLEKQFNFWRGITVFTIGYYKRPILTVFEKIKIQMECWIRSTTSCCYLQTRKIWVKALVNIFFKKCSCSSK